MDELHESAFEGDMIEEESGWGGFADDGLGPADAGGVERLGFGFDSESGGDTEPDPEDAERLEREGRRRPALQRAVREHGGEPAAS